MLKLIGAALLLFAGTMAGFAQSLALARRPRQIRELIQALQRLETEIAYGMTPLAEALASAGRPLSEPVARIFRGAADRLLGPGQLTAEACWQQAVEESWAGTALREAEREVLRQLAYSLGVSDREDQRQHLKLAVAQLQAEETEAAEQNRRFGSMWKSLGVLAGALLVVLMY
ncbi:stage III sporulation protein AB [Paenibacillus sp. J31TS4]|uniref:stage III sporulation protein SpoIIIAB n=1 Tax=Paenibacillus sp. J31TS4 TaxID=2807195 RepID=UPI001B0E8CDF|nr:stage III sporulation protein SpoIIIAB [Paenibacillus sp. J31TS4]GIP37616.1 stage III sporulation protein AB [Paenibacillus sp. J31TS4]